MRRRGFTLIELLVVVAVIALLVSILLPSLSKARELARQSVCLSHMRGAGEALHMYATEQDGWMPGPNTSGLHLTVDYGSYSPNDSTSPSEPVQNMDWISPLLGDSLGLPSSRRDRLVRILNHKMNCPTNRIRYSFQYAPSGTGDSFNIDPSEVTYSSYSAALGFHAVGDGAMTDQRNAIRLHSQVSGRRHLPNSYVPRLERVGRAASKVFAMEGARYVNNDREVSFNDFLRQIAGGNFMLYGPMAPLNGDPFQIQFSGGEWGFAPKAYRFALRHDGRMNCAYFDGHAAPMTDTQARDSEGAWFPEGTLGLQPDGSWDELD